MEDLSSSIIKSFSKISNSFSTLNPPLPEFLFFSSITQAFTDFISSDLFHSGNQIIGNLVLEKILHYSKILENLSLSADHPLKKDQKYEITISVNKLRFLMDCVIPAFNQSPSDLASIDEEHERKAGLRYITTTVVLNNLDKLPQQLKKFYGAVNALKAVSMKIMDYKKSTSRDLMTGWLLVYYSVFAKKKAKILARVFDSGRDFEKLQLMWDSNESKLMRAILPSTYKGVHFNKAIFVPRLAKHVLESNTEPAENTGNLHYTEILAQEPILAGSKYTLSPDPDHIRIPIRIISRIPLPKLEEKLEKSPKPPKSPVQKLEKLIIHIHGGGFASQSTFSHQVYTSRWAAEMDAPVFSIEYRLAPKYPYPDGLDDVWQAYTWLVKYSHKFLGVTPKKIILVGDSAGANLVAALTIKAITAGFRVPDGILFAYPSLNLDRNLFSKSYLLSLEDKIITYSLFYVLIEIYGKRGVKFDDPLLSPLFCSEEVMRKFPETEIMVTMNDPLSFESYCFAEKLLVAGVRVHITEFRDVTHGALFFGNEHAVPLYEQFVDHSCDLLKKLLL